MPGYNSFVIFAEMRTGSNLLEATLNLVKRVTCFGEAFNPYMLGWPDTDQIRGIDMAQREADPMALLTAITSREDHLSGFRYFHDHDPRVFSAIMDNRRCAKIVLTRNPLDSYVSTELARATNQWKLNQTETPIAASITYDGAGFRELLDRQRAFQSEVMRRLQTSGQTAFWLRYEDLRDPSVMLGLLHFLGRTDLDEVQLAGDQVPQNPRLMSEKVANFDAMEADLAGMDAFDIHRLPGFEPERGPAVPSYIAADAGGGLLYMPVRGGPGPQVSAWMEAQGPLSREMSQNALRRWLKERPRHRSFTVLRHPVRRAWDAFTQLLTGGNSALRQSLRDVHRVALPPDDELTSLSDGPLQELFLQFLDLLRRNIAGQTGLPVLPLWATQTEILAGFSRFRVPDMILREDSLRRDLGWLAQSVGLDGDAAALPASPVMPGFLNEKPVLQAARAAYLRDYHQFGFTNRIETGG
ncbi:MAG: hypothetical protein Q4F71_07740 [Paracoccus sp. (in: a-proteobacteria)]|nr:hypothetical protein [Paracoccus sp. (in: a-proteobacteria)]